MECSICRQEIDKQVDENGKVFWDQGHNPDPVMKGDDDRCCSDCNSNVVIPARISGMIGHGK